MDDIIGTILEWAKKTKARELVISGEHDGKTYCAAEQDRNKEMKKTLSLDGNVQKVQW